MKPMTSGRFAAALGLFLCGAAVLPGASGSLSAGRIADPGRGSAAGPARLPECGPPARMSGNGSGAGLSLPHANRRSALQHRTHVC